MRVPRLGLVTKELMSGHTPSSGQFWLQCQTIWSTARIVVVFYMEWTQLLHRVPRTKWKHVISTEGNSWKGNMAQVLKRWKYSQDCLGQALLVLIDNFSAGKKHTYYPILKVILFYYTHHTHVGNTTSILRRALALTQNMRKKKVDQWEHCWFN